MNIFDKMIAWLFIKVCFQIDRAPEKYFHFHYDFSQKDKKNQLASILSIIINSYFDGNHKYQLQQFEYQIFGIGNSHLLKVLKTTK